MAAEKAASIRILYDYWDENGVRHVAPQVMAMPLEMAKQLLAEKKAERADPLPSLG